MTDWRKYTALEFLREGKRTFAKGAQMEAFALEVCWLDEATQCRMG
jgi:hypothetical protein